MRCKNWDFTLLKLILLILVFFLWLQGNFYLKPSQSRKLCYTACILYLWSSNSNFIYCITSNLCYSNSVMLSSTNTRLCSVSITLHRKCSIYVLLKNKNFLKGQKSSLLWFSFHVLVFIPLSLLVLKFGRFSLLTSSSNIPVINLLSATGKNSGQAG